MKKVIVRYLQMPPREHKHAMKVMQELGITWLKDIPQSVTDSWVFYGCENIPEQLPDYVALFEMSAADYELSGIKNAERLQN